MAKKTRECPHTSQYIHSVDDGKPYCALCEIDRLRTRQKTMLAMLSRIRAELNAIQRTIAGDIGELLDD